MNQPHFDLAVVSPHPDDAEMWCGGLLAKSVALGHSVAIIDLTRGELGSRGTPELRAAEAAAASKALGVMNRFQVGLPDGGILAEDSEQLRKVVKLIREVRPELLIVPLDRERHPDHVASGMLLKRAVFSAGLVNFDCGAEAKPWSVRQVLQYPMRVQTSISCVVDISAVQDKKMSAIRAYASQFGLSGEGPITLLSSELSLQSIESRDRWYGAAIGAAYGEPYVSASPIKIDDPVTFFAAHSTFGALLFPEQA